MSKKMFALYQGVNKCPGSFSWQYRQEKDGYTFSNGSTTMFVKGLQVGQIVSANFDGEGTVINTVKVPKDPMRKLAWDYGFTRARMDLAPKLPQYRKFMEPEDMTPSKWFDIDYWAEDGYEPRAFADGGYDATYVNVLRRMIEKDGEWVAVARGRLYASNNGVMKWAVSSMRAFKVFGKEELEGLFKSVHATKREW